MNNPDRCFEDASKILTDSSKLVNEIMHSMGDGLSIQDRNMRIVYQNQFMIDHFGSHIGENCFAVYENRDEICVGCPVVKAFNTGQVNKALRVGVTKEGASFRFENIASPLRNDQGEIVAGMELCRIVEDREKAIDDLQATTERLEETKEELIHDISERKRIEEDLRKERDFAEKLIDTAQAIVLVLDENGAIVRFNRYMEELSGYKLEEVQGRDWSEAFLPPNDKGRFKERFAEAVKGVRTNGQMNPIIAKNGKQFEIEWYDNALRQSDGRVTGVLSIGQDVTERSILQGQLAQAQKLEAIGRLAAGIAHEINTPTNFVANNVRFSKENLSKIFMLLQFYRELKRQLENGEDPSEMLEKTGSILGEADLDFVLEEIPVALEETLEGLDHIAGIVRSMKEFSHPGGKEKELRDLGQAIQNTINITRNEWRYHAEMVTDFDDSLPPAPVLVAEFNQVIMIMIINAVHAIQEVRGDSPDDLGVITVTTRQQGEWAEIRLSDTGPGIPGDIREKVFDPFFTTKEVGKGVGQGLAIAHTIVVNQHGGSIDVETEPGQGATFIVRLPINPEEDGFL